MRSKNRQREGNNFKVQKDRVHVDHKVCQDPLIHSFVDLKTNKKQMKNIREFLASYKNLIEPGVFEAA